MWCLETARTRLTVGRLDIRVVNKEAYFRKIGYEPHAGQARYHASKARFRFACCGRRYGKSTMAGRDLEPKLFLPDRRYWIVGPTYDLGEKEFRVIWQDLIVKMQMGKDRRIKKAYNKRAGDMHIILPWGTSIEVRSADHPENLVGEALHGVIMAEAAKQKQETWERYIRPSLSDFRGFADFPTTPEGFNWLYNEWMRGLDDTQPDYECWRLPSWENPYLFPDGRNDPEIIQLENTTSPEWFMQEIGAEFGSFVGKILSEWDDQRHIRSHTFNPDWPNYVAFDWGWTNPLAAIEFQVSPWDSIHIWREHYKSYLRLEEHIRLMKAREQPDGYHLDLAFGDPADPEAAATVSEKLVACLAMPEQKSEYTWRDGIDLMSTFMKDREIGVEDEYGTPKYEAGYFVDPRCTHTIREHNNYRANDPVKGRNVPEMGNKVSDHTIDAIRGALIHLYYLGANAHLTDIYTVGQTGGPENQGLVLLDSPAGSRSEGTGGFFTLGGEHGPGGF